MKTPFIVGKKIYLRPLEREDLNETYLDWLNDSEVNQYLESGTFPYTREELERFYEQVTGSPNQVILAIVDKETDRHIGNVKLGPINWIHRKATFGILIGEKEFWGQGYGTEATELMVQYAFERLNLRKVTLGVLVKNVGAIKAYERVGFVVEGQLREEAFVEGEYVDGLWMGLLRENYCHRQGEG